nr:phosphoribosyltransferase family protein [Exiguobacterium qingdaonense]
MTVPWTPATLWRRDWVCSSCETRLTPLGTGCPRCGQPNETGETCPDCIRWLALGLDLTVRCLYAYDEAGVEWLHRFKFSGDVVIASSVAQALRRLRSSGVTYVPVPLGEARLRERRFNQAEVLARSIGMTKNYLGKLDVSSQRELGKEERRHRTNPFTVPTSVKCGKIILVDDVYTTGTTLHQAAFSLRQAGATEVSAICLFRALNKSKTRPI